MTDKRMSELTARATLALTDLIEVVADPGGSPTALENYKATLATLRSFFDLANVAGTDADTAMAVNTRYVVDMSAWATADRTYTLPAVFAVGDVVEIVIQSGDASHELLYTAAAGDTCNGVAGGTEVSRLFITGEVVRFVGAVANSAWIVANDGRIPMKGVMELTTPATAEAANTFVAATSQSGALTARTDIGNVTTVATGKFKFRRACKANISVSARFTTAFADGKYGNAALILTAGSGTGLSPPTWSSQATLAPFANGTSFAITFGVDAELQYQYRTEEGNKGLVATAQCQCSFVEVLP